MHENDSRSTIKYKAGKKKRVACIALSHSISLPGYAFVSLSLSVALVVSVICSINMPLCVHLVTRNALVLATVLLLLLQPRAAARTETAAAAAALALPPLHCAYTNLRLIRLCRTDGFFSRSQRTLRCGNF